MPTIEIESLERYGYADPAAGKDARNKRRRARQSIVIGARDWLDRWFWVYLWAGHLTASQFRDKIIDINERFNPRRFGIEANGMQILFGNLVREAAKERESSMTMIPVYQPTNIEKNFRIRTGLEPVINGGRFFVQETQVEAIAEIQGFPTAATKDLVDAMETCIRTAPRRPVNTTQDTEAEQYAAYLRNSGMPAHLIKGEMAKFQSSRPTTTQ